MDLVEKCLRWYFHAGGSLILRFTIDDKVQWRIYNYKKVIDCHHDSGPFRKLCSLAIQNIHKFVDGDEDLADVTHEEQEDDSEEDEGDSSVATTSCLFLEWLKIIDLAFDLFRLAKKWILDILYTNKVQHRMSYL